MMASPQMDYPAVLLSSTLDQYPSGRLAASLPQLDHLQYTPHCFIIPLVYGICRNQARTPSTSIVQSITFKFT